MKRPEVSVALASGVAVTYLIVSLIGLIAVLGLLLVAFHSGRMQLLWVAVRLARIVHLELEMRAKDEDQGRAQEPPTKIIAS